MILLGLSGWPLAELEAADFRPARTASLGGAGRAGPLLNDSIYLNPAFLAFLKSYTASAQYEWDRGATRGRILHLSVQDGSSEFFAAGLGYTVRNDAKFLNAGLGRVILPRLSVGLGAKARLPGAGQRNYFDGNIGVSYIHSNLLQFAFTVDNVLETANKRNVGLVREFAIGSRINIDNIWVIYVDPHWAPNIDEKFGFDIGMEFMMFTDVTFKIGHFRGSRVPHLNQIGKGYSAGAGWVGPRLSLDLAIVRTLEPLGTTSTIGAFTVFF